MYVCNEGFYNYSVANSNGYGNHLRRYVAGHLESHHKASWKGNHNNKTFMKLQDEIFRQNFSTLEIVDLGIEQGSSEIPTEKIFMPTHGFCLKLKKTSKEISLRSSGSFMFLLVDPAKDTKITIQEVKFSKIEIGPTATGHHTGKVYAIQVSIHDSRIHNGIACTEYNQLHSTYGECIENALKQQVMNWYGCLPPWFPLNSSFSCEEKEAKTLTEMDWQTIEKEIGRFNRGQKIKTFEDCLQPCLHMSLKIVELKSFKNRVDVSYVQMEFEDDVIIHTDVHAYDMFSLVIGLRSSLGLWLGLSALSIFDAILNAYGVTRRRYYH